MKEEKKIVDFFKGKDYMLINRGTTSILYNVSRVKVNSVPDANNNLQIMVALESENSQSNPKITIIPQKEVDALMRSGEYHDSNVYSHDKTYNSYVNFPIEVLKKRFVGKHITNQFHDNKRHLISGVEIIKDDMIFYNNLRFLHAKGKEITNITFDTVTELMKNNIFSMSVGSSWGNIGFTIVID